MTGQTTLRIYLEGSMLRTARDGTFPFMAVLEKAVHAAGWRVEWHQSDPAARASAPDSDGYALFHAEAPTHDRALTFRRAYHYPFWQIEPAQQRWRFHVARSPFDADRINPQQARDFADRLRQRVIPGAPPTRDGPILIALQGHIRRCRSFQTTSPVEMVEQVARIGRPTVATLHPKESYDARDMAALQAVAARHPNLRLGGDTMALLRDCPFVVTQNSAVAFDGFLLGKPAVLFAQIDFHHIALNMADDAQALEKAETHRPDFDRYLFWFLQEKAINATLPDAGARILTAMRRGGWPI
ncbi:hypothetical protein [Paracoccus laeviglucosivorans]|uniref:Capsule polysaccharide biosynthesis protein n=1 Tax=Paracoccus laeviglucosivorans TaxID=1197861 RepID=A0A521DK73_9RHOB|nr:hypothetical protein [Paracoccus laeviglucosivorans]SMO72134.1 hypothetical protein SAMN06265221_108118 [Paracoccus laeviglucosivorans]